MTDIRAQVILHTVDNVPENYVSNSWCFRLDSTAGAGGLLTPILKDFYDDITSWLSPVLSGLSNEIKYSLLPGTKPNYPFEEDVFSISPVPTGSALPDELAVCMSFQGDRQAGFPQSRRRGRLYIGPLDSTAASANRPNPTILAGLGTAAATLKLAVDAIGGTAAWCVWSTVDQASVPVADGWIDNAFDVQRRRGVLPTSRTTF
jgi:hypothetical protein